MHKTITILLLLITTSVTAQKGEEALKKMYQRYHGKWYPSFTFVQTTEMYRNDSLVRTQTWYEAAIFPERFRIDRGLPDSGNAVIYRGDSAYTFRAGKLIAARKQDNLTFLIGGMYFYPYETTVKKMNDEGYNTGKGFETTWNGKPVYVIGADNETEKTSQLWVDKEKLCVVRFFNYTNGRKQEGVLENHIKAGNGWTETECTFYLDGKLVQKEYYHDFKPGAFVDERLFDPAKFGEWHWFKK